MTSEVVVMNRLAVALAADSASTVGGPNAPKIWNSANKLFALSKCHPVGVMVYNSASVLGVPWETVIKAYRAHLGKEGFGSLEEYGRDFFAFVNGNSLLFPRDTQTKYFRRSLDSTYSRIRQDARSQWFDRVVAGEKELTQDEVFDSLVSSELARWEAFDDLNTSAAHTEEAIVREFGAVIEEAIAANTGGVAVLDDGLLRLKKLAFLLVTKAEFGDAYTGIVFAGFGGDEHFPVLQHFSVGEMVLDQVKCSAPVVEKVSDDTPTVLKPFAQSQMVETFLEGINPSLRYVLTRSFIGLALTLPETVLDAVTDLTEEQRNHWKAEAATHSKAAIYKMLEEVNQHRYERHWAPVHAALIHLPKDELASVAEALVNLSSFQKIVSMETETVGGPVDVAVISKGDGLIWIKRKHYFSRELNEHYFNNLRDQ